MAGKTIFYKIIVGSIGYLYAISAFSNPSVGMPHFQRPANNVIVKRIGPQADVSQIYGKLTNTGQVILVNPAGIYLGPGIFVNFNSFIANPVDIKGKHSSVSNYKLNIPAGYSTTKINKGTIISAQNGLMALVGNQVSDNGLIEANAEKVALASRNVVTVNFAGNDLINFTLNHAENATLHHETDTGSQVLVSAKQASGVLDNVISMKGVAQTKSVYQKNGEIIFAG